MRYGGGVILPKKQTLDPGVVHSLGERSCEHCGGPSSTPVLASEASFDSRKSFPSSSQTNDDFEAFFNYLRERKKV